MISSRRHYSREHLPLLSSLLLVLVFSLSFPLAAVSRNCPKGQVLLEGKCVYKNLCKDGRVWKNHKCINICWDGSRYTGSCPGVDRPSREPDPADPPEIEPAPIPSEQEEISPVAKLKPCQVGTIFNDGGGANGSARQLLMIDGVPTSLLLRYLADADAEAVNVNLSELKVLIPMSGEIELFSGQEHAALSFGEQLAGKSVRAKWLETLKGLTADPIRDPIEEAESYEADLICGRGE